MNVVNTDRHEGRRLRGFRDGRANENAVIQAEIRRLVSAIRPFGVLNKDALAHEARAEHWREGGLDRALNASVDEGLLEARPFGFYNESSRKNRATGSQGADRARSAGGPVGHASSSVPSAPGGSTAAC